MIIKKDIELFRNYLSDASNFQGNADVLYIPKNTDELKECLIECNSTNLPVTISGAGTGLTGGRVSLNGAIISTEKLNRIISINKFDKSAILESGVLVSELENELSGTSLFYPPNPTEKDSSIGGNIANNASGARTFKYGATRNFIEQLSIVLINGDNLIISNNKNNIKQNIIYYKSVSGKEYNIPISKINYPNIKNATGYYLNNEMNPLDLFIGSEGTLGVVTEATIKLIDEPENILGGIIFFDDENLLLDFVNYIRDISIERNKKHYSDIDKISARVIEFFDSNSLKLLKEIYSQIPDKAIGAIWIEQEHSSNNEDSVLTDWLDTINKYTNLADDTWIAQAKHEHENLREFRHKLPQTVNEMLVRNNQRKIGTDTAVPKQFLNEFYSFLSNVLKNSGFNYLIFGHIGNSHFHANIFTNSSEEFNQALILYEKIIMKSLQFGGTVSAEHGIGKIKKKYFYMMFCKNDIEKMIDIKKIFDPKLLLNQGNLFE